MTEEDMTREEILREGFDFLIEKSGITTFSPQGKSLMLEIHEMLHEFDNHKFDGSNSLIMQLIARQAEI